MGNQEGAGAIEKDLDSSIDGVADSVRLYLPYAKANRWNPRAGIENKGFSHLWTLVKETRARSERKAERGYQRSRFDGGGWEWGLG